MRKCALRLRVLCLSVYLSRLLIAVAGQVHSADRTVSGIIVEIYSAGDYYSYKEL